MAGIAWGLAEKFDIHCLGLQSFQDEKVKVNMQGIERTVHQHANQPRSKDRWDFGQRSLPRLLDNLEPDILLTVNDIQMVQHIPQTMCPNMIQLNVVDLPSKQYVSDEALLQQLKGQMQKFKERFPRETKWIQYAPQDGDPPMPQWEHIYRMADSVVAMSRYGQWVFKTWFNMDVPWIYHGVDTNTFKDLNNKPKEMENLFIVGNLNRNQPRKQPVRTMMAFAKFAKDKKDVALHMQMDWNDEFGWPLEYFVRQYGIQNKMIQPAQVGIGRKQVANIYNMWDLNLNACFHPDTQVITNPGTKQIKDIEKGDKVLTADGKFHKVREKVKFKYKGKLMEVTPAYLDSIKLTPNHKIFRLKQNVFGSSDRKHKAKDNPEIEEIQARDLNVGDVMLFPRPKEQRRSKESNDLMRLYGLYLAEGCIVQHKNRNQIDGLVFCIHTKEKELTDFILKIMKNEYNLNGIVKDKDRNRRTIWFYSAEVGKKFKDMFSDNSHTKQIPGKFIYYKNEKLKWLIKGLWDGDGHIETREGHSTKYELQTVSKQLGYQIWIILQKLGYLTSLHKQVRQSDVYRIAISGHQGFESVLGNKNGDKGKKLSIGWTDKDFMYYPIRHISFEDYDGEVYDLNVEKVHNYCSQLLGHNTGGEGFGLTHIEGFACGVPSLACDYTTSKELIMEGEPSPRGHLLKVMDLHWQMMDVAAVRRSLVDTDDFAAVLNKYYYNRDLCIQHGKNALEWSQNNVSWEIIGKQWIKHVEGVLSGDNGNAK